MDQEGEAAEEPNGVTQDQLMADRIEVVGGESVWRRRWLTEKAQAGSAKFTVIAGLSGISCRGVHSRVQQENHDGTTERTGHSRTRYWTNFWLARRPRRLLRATGCLIS